MRRKDICIDDSQDPSWKITERVSATGFAWCKSGKLVIASACFAIFASCCFGSNTDVASLCPLVPLICSSLSSPLMPKSDRIELLATSSALSIRIVFGTHTLPLPFPWPLLPSSAWSLGCLPSVRGLGAEETEGALVGDERACGWHCTGQGRLQAPGTMQPQ